MASLTLARRLSAIIIVLILIVWLIMVMSSYLGKDWEEQSFRPSPDRLAAIVEALEDAHPDQRPGILAALNTPVLSIRIVMPSEKMESRDASGNVSDDLARQYRSRLGDRPITVSRFAALREERDIPHFPWNDKSTFEFRIGMRTGETLIIHNTSPVIATPFGLPIGLGAGLLGSLAALAALVALYREIRPLGALARAVDHIDLNGETISFPDTKGQSAEIKALVTAFDQMQHRLSQLLRSRMAMIAGISHDVRTFATRLRLKVDAIPDADKRERAIRDITDMIHMLDDALLAARIGAGDLPQELIDLTPLARSEVSERQKTGADVSFLAQAGGSTFILGDPLSLRRVIGNLIDNAIKYAGSAHVSVMVDAGYVVLCVEDDGPGIPAESADLLTEPFVRGEVSRNRDTGGAGLGLAIAKNLAEAHGGDLSIGTANSGGARIEVRLPIYEY
ncbi:ATP-binding protein [Agrobacterium sp. B1(2019)]|uniref:sensor histidine kinase n=1 Tax=Agrobacterium sp. B1(2019) TaxID=2607032 RepID=UPI0011ECE894|nr:ATP-binding protein [Agrobacterium sp. B1(2019)]TZG32462.1 HAMP domain-containing protein [Agrobacterium sp. B1(2019)]